MVDEAVEIVEVLCAESTTEVFAFALEFGLGPTKLPTLTVFAFTLVGFRLRLSATERPTILVATDEDVFATAILDNMLFEVVWPREILVTPRTPPCSWRDFRRSFGLIDRFADV
jgi:hypothetical protein